MFEQAMKRVIALPEHERKQFIKRLMQVRTPGQEIGWGVGYAFDALSKQAGLRPGSRHEKAR